MTEGIGMCWACKRLRDSAVRMGEFEVSTCDAFPDGIPVEIFVDGFDHRLPFEGDGGLLFVANTPEDEALAMKIIRQERM